MYSKILKSYYKTIGLYRAALVFALSFVANVLDVFSLTIFIPVIETLIGENQARSLVSDLVRQFLEFFSIRASLENLIFLIIGVSVLKIAILIYHRRLSTYLASEIQRKSRYRIISGFLYSQFTTSEHFSKSELMSIVTEHINRYSNTFFLLTQLLVHALNGALISLVLAYLSIEITGLVFLSFFLIFPLLHMLGKLTKQSGREYADQITQFYKQVDPIVEAKRMLVSLGAQSEAARVLKTITESLSYTWKKSAFYSNSPSFFVQPAGIILASVIILWSVNLDISTATLGSFGVCFIRMLPTFQSLATASNEIRSHQFSIAKVLNAITILDSKPMHSESQDKFSHSKSIEVRDLSLRYGSREIAKAFSTKIDRGSYVAIIGASGSGKSAFLDALVGFNRFSAGGVFFDDINRNTINDKIFFQKVAYVGQRPFFLPISIKDNLIFGLEDVDLSYFEQICADFKIQEFISNIPEKFDYILKEDLSNLSGGELQRLSLARAVLRKPEILILDEATSAMDQETQSVILSALKKLNSSLKTTIIFVSHRTEVLSDVSHIIYTKEFLKVE